MITSVPRVISRSKKGKSRELSSTSRALTNAVLELRCLYYFAVFNSNPSKTFTTKHALRETGQAIRSRRSSALLATKGVKKSER